MVMPLLLTCKGVSLVNFTETETIGDTITKWHVSIGAFSWGYIIQCQAAKVMKKKSFPFGIMEKSCNFAAKSRKEPE